MLHKKNFFKITILKIHQRNIFDTNSLSNFLVFMGSAKTKVRYFEKQCFEYLDRNKQDLVTIKDLVFCHDSIKCN